MIHIVTDFKQIVARIKLKIIKIYLNQKNIARYLAK